MNNFLQHKSTPLFLAIVLSVAGFGAFALDTFALTESQQAQINTQVALDPLVSDKTAEVAAAQTVLDAKNVAVETARGFWQTAKDDYDLAVSEYQTAVANNDAYILPQNPNALQSVHKAELQALIAPAEQLMNEKSALLAPLATAYSDAKDARDIAQGILTTKQTGLSTATTEATAIATAGISTQSQVTALATQTTSAGATAEYNILHPQLDANGNPITTGQPTSFIGSFVGPPTPEQAGVSQDNIVPKPLPLTAEEDQLSKTVEPCGLLDILCNFATLPFRLIYVPASWLLWIAGYIFDATITLSIDKFYVNQDFVTNTWTIIRDFSNMLFIFVLLYTGIMTIFGQIDWRKTVLNVIVVALLINFSLFFTKVVIDAGNILSVGIFQAMGVAKESDGMLSGGGERIKERNLSQSIVANFQPAQFLKIGGGVDPWGAAAIFIVAAIVNIFAAYILFKAALLFIGRLLAFWFLMIISPFAFISITLPKMSIFSEWLETLLNQTFVAPIFLFLLYLIMKILTVSDLVASFTNTSGVSGGKLLFAKLLGPILVAALLISALQYILKITTKRAGSFGSMASEYAGKALGFAAGGVAGVAGRQVIGGLAAQALKKNWVAPGGAAAGVAKYLTKSSFDVRNVGGVVGGAVETVVGKVAGEYAGEVAGKWASGTVTQGVGTLGVGAGTGAGGVAATEKAKAQRQRAKDAKARNQAEIPILKAKLQTMISDHNALKARNGDTANTQGTVLRTELTTAENSLLTADLARQGNPSDPTLQTNYVAALADKKTKEKTFEKYDKGQEKIEKLEKQIETYENL